MEEARRNMSRMKKCIYIVEFSFGHSIFLKNRKLPGKFKKGKSVKRF